MNLLGKAVNAVCFWGGAALGELVRADYLAKARRGVSISEKALKSMLHRSRDTEYGKRYGFSSIGSVEDFQKAVPLSTYDDYLPYITRMVEKGEETLITANKISYYATSSGTVGQTKLLPQMAKGYGNVFKIICLMLRDGAVAMRRRHVCGIPARGLMTTEIKKNPVKTEDKEKSDAAIGSITSYTINGVKWFLPLFTPLPKEAFEGGIRNLRYIKARYALQDPEVRWLTSPFMSALTDIVSYIVGNQEMLLRDIENGVIDPSVEMTDEVRRSLEKKLLPDPQRAAELREIFAAPSDEGMVAKIWKKLAYINSVGAGDFSPFTKKMLHWCGPDIYISYSSYLASEAWIGYAIHFNDPSYLLLLDGNFYEFLPVGEDGVIDEEHPKLMQELETGKYYEIVVTTPAGLYRYRMRDVLKVTGFEGQTPYLEFAYRANRATDLCGAHINDEFVIAAIAAVEKETGLRIDDYSLYADAEATPPRIVMFVEPERPVSAEERGRMRRTFEAAMVKGGRGYRIGREAGNLAPSELYTVKQGSYMRYRQMRVAAGASENQLKSIRVIKSAKDREFFRSCVDDDAQTAEGVE